MQVKMKTVPAGVFIQGFRQFCQGIRPVICERNVHSVSSFSDKHTGDSISLVPDFCHSSHFY